MAVGIILRGERTSPEEAAKRSLLVGVQAERCVTEQTPHAPLYCRCCCRSAGFTATRWVGAADGVGTRPTCTRGGSWWGCSARQTPSSRL